MLYTSSNNQTYFQLNNSANIANELDKHVECPQFRYNEIISKNSYNKNLLAYSQLQQSIFKTQKPLFCITQYEHQIDLRINDFKYTSKQKIFFNKKIIQKSLNIMKKIKADLQISSVKKNTRSFIKKKSKNQNNASKFLSQSYQNPVKKQQNPQIKIFADFHNKQQKSNHLQQNVEQPLYLILKIKNRVQIFISLRYLDSGSSGKIYLVYHVATGFIMCMKMYPKAMFTEESLNQLLRQIKIQSCINHPNIVALYGFALDTENVYLFLQPCLGSNAFKKFSQNPISEKEVKKYMKEVTSAIQYLHMRQILHRDIKAQNVVFHQNVAKICDFGWAVQLSEFRSTQCGTPVYLAPQLIKCQNYDNKIDVWSIGVLTYELLFGKNPFQIKAFNELQNILQNEVEFQSHLELTDKAKDFIMHCLAKLAPQRLNIFYCVQHQFLTDETQQFRPSAKKK